MARVSILLVEDSRLFASALVNLFSRDRTLNLSVWSSGFFLNQTPKTGHDVVLIDAVTWAASEQALVDAVRQASSVTPVILLGRDDLIKGHSEAMQAGAVGFLKQTAGPKTIVKAVKAVTNGKVWFDSRVFHQVFIQSTPVDLPPRRIQFNQKERRILDFLAVGKTNKEIGTLLGCSERTVKAHVSNLFRKTGASNRSGLVGHAILHGLAHLAQGVGT